MAFLKVDKITIKVSCIYANFINVFNLKLVIKLSKYTNYAIKLVNNWQYLYSSIYNLGFIKVEILKTSIINNLSNNFIRLS